MCWNENIIRYSDFYESQFHRYNVRVILTFLFSGLGLVCPWWDVTRSQEQSECDLMLNAVDLENWKTFCVLDKEIKYSFSSIFVFIYFCILTSHMFLCVAFLWGLLTIQTRSLPHVSWADPFGWTPYYIVYNGVALHRNECMHVSLNCFYLWSVFHIQHIGILKCSDVQLACGN